MLLNQARAETQRRRDGRPTERRSSTDEAGRSVATQQRLCDPPTDRLAARGGAKPLDGRRRRVVLRRSGEAQLLSATILTVGSR